MEILRADDTRSTNFGQVHVSATYPDEVRAWCYHEVKMNSFACMAGAVKLVLVDTRPESPTAGVVNEFFVGTQHPLLVQVPNLVSYGWKCIGSELSLVVNVTEPCHHTEPDDHWFEPRHTLTYDWACATMAEGARLG
jgi:dTDP-4-dehydrorhamnose 3,5-epimerase